MDYNSPQMIRLADIVKLRAASGIIRSTVGLSADEKVQRTLLIATINTWIDGLEKLPS